MVPCPGVAPGCGCSGLLADQFCEVLEVVPLSQSPAESGQGAVVVAGATEAGEVCDLGRESLRFGCGVGVTERGGGTTGVTVHAARVASQAFSSVAG